MKEWSLYVDCIDEDFKPVESFIESIPGVLDYFFAAVEQRVDAFGDIHATEESSAEFLRRIAEEKAGKDYPAEPGFRFYTPAASLIELRARLRSALGHCVRYESPFEVIASMPMAEFLSKHYATVHDREMLRQAVEQETVSLGGRLGIKALVASSVRAKAMLDLLARAFEPARPSAD